MCLCPSEPLYLHPVLVSQLCRGHLGLTAAAAVTDTHTRAYRHDCAGPRTKDTTQVRTSAHATGWNPLGNNNGAGIAGFTARACT